jgi:hypothetical protein
VQHDFVEAAAEFVGDIQRLFARTRRGEDGVEPARLAAELAEFSYDVAFQVELVDASDEDHLARPWGDTQRPRRAVQAPFLLEIPVGVEDL